MKIASSRVACVLLHLQAPCVPPCVCHVHVWNMRLGVRCKALAWAHALAPQSKCDLVAPLPSSCTSLPAVRPRYGRPRSSQVLSPTTPTSSCRCGVVWRGVWYTTRAHAHAHACSCAPVPAESVVVFCLRHHLFSLCTTVFCGAAFRHWPVLPSRPGMVVVPQVLLHPQPLRWVRVVEQDVSMHAPVFDVSVSQPCV